MDKDIKKGFKKIEDYRIDLDNVMTYYPVLHDGIHKHVNFLMYKGTDVQVWWNNASREENPKAEKVLNDLDIIFFGKSEAEEKLFE